MHWILNMETEIIGSVQSILSINQGSQLCRRSNLLSWLGHRVLCFYIPASPGHNFCHCSARHTFAQVQKGYDLSLRVFRFILFWQNWPAVSRLPSYKHNSHETRQKQWSFILTQNNVFWQHKSQIICSNDKILDFCFDLGFLNP